MTSRFQDIANELSLKKGLGNAVFEAGGAFKETFRVEDADGTPYALKILDPAKCVLSRVERETDAMFRCNLPYIAKLHEYGSTVSISGTNYIFAIEEFLDGGTLTARLNASIAPNSVRHYGTCLSLALEQLASLDLVHRDIKPDNVMFRSGSDDPILVDFGLVRNLAEVSLTQTWSPQGPGTPLYSSPEQLNNEKSMIKWRSDQFSLGIVLGICLTGQHPFASAGMTEPEVVNRIAMRGKCDKDFSDAVVNLGFPNIVRMLEPWPIQRYPTPTDLKNSFKI